MVDGRVTSSGGTNRPNKAGRRNGLPDGSCPPDKTADFKTAPHRREFFTMKSTVLSVTMSKEAEREFHGNRGAVLVDVTESDIPAASADNNRGVHYGSRDL